MTNNEQSTPISIPISSLSPQQIQNIYHQISSEIKMFSNTSEQLLAVVKKYKASIQAIQRLESMRDEKILIPCTESLYVDGSLKDNKKVLVDIGTGYYVKMSNTGAVQFFNRRIEYISGQIKSVDAVLTEKSKVLQAIENAIVAKSQNDELGSKIQQTKIA